MLLIFSRRFVALKAIGWRLMEELYVLHCTSSYTQLRVQPKTSVDRVLHILFFRHILSTRYKYTAIAILYPKAGIVTTQRSSFLVFFAFDSVKQDHSTNLPPTSTSKLHQKTSSCVLEMHECL